MFKTFVSLLSGHASYLLTFLKPIGPIFKFQAVQGKTGNVRIT